jgi:7,8-dihydro-6-hydroxymethylpterin-pyrophosphokinase
VIFPMFFASSAPFLNMAALVETILPARALLAICLEIEQAMGVAASSAGDRARLTSMF